MSASGILCTDKGVDDTTGHQILENIYDQLIGYTMYVSASSVDIDHIHTIGSFSFDIIHSV